MPERVPGGVGAGLPISIVRSGTLRADVKSLIRGSNYRLWYERFEDFDQATLPSPWATKIVGTTPTVAKVANGVNGVWRGTLAATSEAETAGVDFGDSLMLNVPDAGATNVNPLARPNFEAYVRFPIALTTAQTAVIGLATAFNATLTSIAEYAWFRLTASMAVTLEGKDGTTTTTGQVPTSAPTLVAGTFALFSISIGQGQAVFWLDDAYIGSVPMGALTAAMKLQPVIYLQKASGTTVPQVEVDWANAMGWRV